MSSKSLSQQIGVSSRTIREDIKQLTTELTNEGITVLSIPGKGYSIHNQDKEKASRYYAEKMGEKKAVTVSPESRTTHILQVLLFAEQAVTLDELADNIYVSRSTIEKDIVEAEKWLLAQKLQLLKKPAVGIQVTGSEIALRYAMVNCLLEHGMGDAPIGEILRDLADKKQVHAIQHILREVQQTYKMFLSDVDHKHLIIYLCIVLYRVGQGHEVQCSMEEMEGMRTSTAYRIADQIGGMVFGAEGRAFPEAERVCLAQYLMQTHLFVVEDFSIDKPRREELLSFVKMTVAKNDKQYQTAFAGDDELIFILVLYLQSLLNRKDHKIISKNPSLNEIREEYPLALEMAAATAKAIEHDYQVLCNQNEVGDIALHYCAAIERFKTREAVESTPGSDHLFFWHWRLPTAGCEDQALFS